MVTLLGLVHARERLFHQLPEGSISHAIFQWCGVVEVVEAVESGSPSLLYICINECFSAVIYSILDFGKRLE